MRNSSESVVVVGDRFASFASHPGVVTVSELAATLGSDAGPAPGQIVVGQGVSESWLAHLRAVAHERAAAVEFINADRPGDRPGRQLCHKWQRSNILITRPERLSESLFSLKLSIDDDCEIMSDHGTGQHVQGMVLIEAARQTFLTVTERFLLDGRKYYFIIDRFDIAFKRFVFPLDVSIEFEILSADRSRTDRLKANSQVRFYQCSELVCQMEVGYAAILESALNVREATLASETLAHHRKVIAETRSTGQLAVAGVPAP